MQALAANFMENFRIKASSWVIYIITFTSILSSGAILGKRLMPANNNNTAAIILFAIMLAVSILATRFAGIATTSWTITSKDIQIKWVTQFIFHKRPDITISWDDIKGYNIRQERSFELLKLILKNGTVFRIWHDKLITKDDFEKFVTYFLVRVDLHNKAELENSGRAK
jgi:hypothetical protein